MLTSSIIASGEVVVADKSLVQKMPTAIRLPIEGKFPSIGGATGWLNSPPLTVTGPRGKVVPVDLWTYSCINSLRTLPYVRAWAEKYRVQGLMVIGVHSPELEFEKNVDNVRKAVMDMKVEYPVAIDSDYAIWHAFENHYWPALYIVDTKGTIRHQQFGEGGYEQSARIIQQFLAETGSAGIGTALARYRCQCKSRRPHDRSCRSAPISPLDALVSSNTIVQSTD